MADPVGDALNALNKAVRAAQQAAAEVDAEKSTMDAAVSVLAGPPIENEAQRRELIAKHNEARKNWTAAKAALQKALADVATANAELQRQLIILTMK